MTLFSNLTRWFRKPDPSVALSVAPPPAPMPEPESAPAPASDPDAETPSLPEPEFPDADIFDLRTKARVKSAGLDLDIASARAEMVEELRRLASRATRKKHS